MALVFLLDSGVGRGSTFPVEGLSWNSPSGRRRQNLLTDNRTSRFVRNQLRQRQTNKHHRKPREDR